MLVVLALRFHRPTAPIPVAIDDSDAVNDDWASVSPSILTSMPVRYCVVPPEKLDDIMRGAVVDTNPAFVVMPAVGFVDPAAIRFAVTLPVKLSLVVIAATVNTAPVSPAIAADSVSPTAYPVPGDRSPRMVTTPPTTLISAVAPLPLPVMFVSACSR